MGQIFPLIREMNRIPSSGNLNILFRESVFSHTDRDSKHTPDTHMAIIRPVDIPTHRHSQRHNTTQRHKNTHKPDTQKNRPAIHPHTNIKQRHRHTQPQKFTEPYRHGLFPYTTGKMSTEKISLGKFPLGNCQGTVLIFILNYSEFQAMSQK